MITETVTAHYSPEPREGRQSLLLDILASESPSYDAQLHRILRTASQALDVERVSYWALFDEPLRIECHALYVRTRDDFESGHVLRGAEYPKYFEALHTGEVVAATDAESDPRTSEFREGYLAPLGIGAMLDVPVYVDGQLQGVVCHEHVGPSRPWREDEQQFALSMGQLASLAIEGEQRQRAEAALRDSENWFRAMVEAAPVPMLVIKEPEGTILYLNGAASELLGMDPAEAVGRPTASFYQDPGERPSLLEELVRSGAIKERELALKKADGTPIWVLVSIQRLLMRDSEVAVVGLIDVTERKAMEDQLRHLALHDPLTDLPNRVALYDAARRELARCRRNRGTSMALLFVDLNGFKGINDELGHDAGDQVLKEAAARIRAATREQDFAARIGGDEFAVVVTAMADREDATHVASRIVTSLGEPFDTGVGLRTIGASVGIAIDCGETEDPEMMLRRADQAMYRVKSTGRSGYSFADCDPV